MKQGSKGECEAYLLFYRRAENEVQEEGVQINLKQKSEAEVPT